MNSYFLYLLASAVALTVILAVVYINALIHIQYVIVSMYSTYNILNKGIPSFFVLIPIVFIKSFDVQYTLSIDLTVLH